MPDPAGRVACICDPDSETIPSAVKIVQDAGRSRAPGQSLLSRVGNDTPGPGIWLGSAFFCG